MDLAHRSEAVAAATSLVGGLVIALSPLGTWAASPHVAELRWSGSDYGAGAALPVAGLGIVVVAAVVAAGRLGRRGLLASAGLGALALAAAVAVTVQVKADVDAAPVPGRGVSDYYSAVGWWPGAFMAFAGIAAVLAAPLVAELLRPGTPHGPAARA